MRETPRSHGGIVTAPHHLAAQAGRDILAVGGTAVEATIAMAATLAVVYPHMTGLGGDGFWLIGRPGQAPRAIDASGCAVAAARLETYAGHAEIPQRGVLAANTVAGTVGGWQKALEISRDWQQPLPHAALMASAIRHATTGFAVSRSQAALTATHLPALREAPGFSGTFLLDGVPPREADRMRLPRLAATLEALARDGFDSFYRGPLAARIAQDMARIDGLVTEADLAGWQAAEVAPLSLTLRDGSRLFNLPAPTQGMASLAILGIADLLPPGGTDSFEHVHGLIEATKAAFRQRDAIIGDPQLSGDQQAPLTAAALQAAARGIDMQRAAPWPHPATPGDTIWCGAVDAAGNMTSFIQSIFFEFGSGVVLQDSGLTWQNRGSSFTLATEGLRALAPGRKPFHTLNPAMAEFPDGRRMSYGTMGGEGQPQTQAAVFSRHARGVPLQEAVTRPRWLLGRTWGDAQTTLKLEADIGDGLIAALRAAGHEVELLPAHSSTMGHAGALVLHPDGLCEGATDPRSDGAVAAL
ncbi:gamma-glutamyltransferase [Cereibacter changlensis JA139]|uniref:Gamma-glutamyltransferase n=2 Tax=Cereibacter changlensis TaxID=402884 RepID=A0A2T4JP54_9RHOB|nr:gamma-glutamyltransferase [Cereibacter changlensis]PTE19686.1 gamma-glutamyltransferase [Cereibacter changlensis JA139]PZX56318.1 gamma-glutamyltranspeptidase/glutathione hydrolase [Cereibacter changlensis]